MFDAGTCGKNACENERIGSRWEGLTLKHPLVPPMFKYHKFRPNLLKSFKTIKLCAYDMSQFLNSMLLKRKGAERGVNAK